MDNEFINDNFIDDEPLSSYIDKDEYLMMMGTSDKIYWDKEKYTFDEFEKVLKEALDEVIEEFTKDGIFYVDDWDLFDYETIYYANQKLGNHDD